MKKNYYSQFDSFKKELKDYENKINEDLDSYKAAKGIKNIKDIENRLDKNLDSFNKLIEELNVAYNNKNAPSYIRQDIIINKREEINEFNESYKKLKNSFDSLKKNKNSNKGYISENNRNKEEFVDIRDANQQIQKALEDQDNKAEDAKELVEEGLIHIKDLNKEIDDSKKKVKKGTNSIVNADSQMIKLNNRLVKYLANSNNWCLRISLIVEIVIAIALIIVFTKV